MDYLSQICNLAAVFAGFTAIVSVLGSYDDGPDDVALNKLRLRQMLETCLFTIAAGLVPQLLASFGMTLDRALQIAGALSAPTAALLLMLQGRRGLSTKFRHLSGYSVHFARFAISAGVLLVGMFFLAAFGIRPVATYNSAVTLGLAIAGLQFLRTSFSVLQVPASIRKPFDDT